MNYVDTIITESFQLYFIYLIELAINLIVCISIFKAVSNFIKRKESRNYFKNNVVINEKLDSKKVKGNKYQKVYNDVSKEELTKFNTEDIETLKEYFYNIFLDFEKAYNNLDLSVIKSISTKQLYQNYYTGITLDLKVGKKRVISEIEKKNIVIFELDSTIAKQVASVMIEISYINYTIDKNGNVISGSRDTKVTEKFEVVFRKDFEKEEITKCSSCGAAVIGNKCEFCRTTIKNIKFKISSIKKIIDQK